MGTYLNPGDSGFSRIVRNDYVDKTGLIGIINKTIDTTKNLTCISRPRRFGKSYAAQMLCAYYDKSCDSHELFDQYTIAGDAAYNTHINKYDVIYLDMTGIIGETTLKDIVPYIKRNITEEIRKTYPQVTVAEGFVPTLVSLVQYTHNRIVMIIDEWDAPIREARDKPTIQKEYLEFLRSLFKNSGTTSKIFAAAYMTGILPIKKDGSQSAISDFEEYSVLEPGDFAGFESVGDVVAHVHVGKDRVVLENHAHIAAVRGDLIDYPAVDPDFAALDRVKPDDHAKQRRLPAAGGPQQREELAGPDIQGKSVYDGVIPVTFDYVVDFNGYSHADSFFQYM